MILKNYNEITPNNVYFGLLNIYDNIEAEINRISSKYNLS